MSGVQYIQQGVKRILLIDLSHISDFGLLTGLVDEAIRLVQTNENPGSARTLVDLSGTRINKHVVSALKKLSQKNGRYAKATAFVGLDTFWCLALTSLFLALGKRNHKVFRTRRDTQQWLERQ